MRKYLQLISMPFLCFFVFSYSTNVQADIDKVYIEDIVDVLPFMKKLKEDLTTSQYQYDMAIQIDNKKIAELEEEIKELKEENNDLQTQVDHLVKKKYNVKLKKAKKNIKSG